MSSSPFLGEFIGTALLIIMGGGVVANVVLNKSKGQNSGWIVITFGWAMAVFLGVYSAKALGSFGHLNPAVTISAFAFGNLEDTLLAPYLGGQFAGAMLGAIIVWVAYKQHFDETNDAATKLAVFSTAPAIRNPLYNLLTEVIGTFILVFGATLSGSDKSGNLSLGALPVALLVLGIGLSLGGPTGYAINPARDLGPRIAHAILPIRGKGSSDWSYAWIPVVGPIIGALAAAAVISAL